MVLQIAGVVGLVGYLSFRNGEQAVTQVVTQLQGEMGDRTTERLTSWLNQPIQMTELVVQAVERDQVGFRSGSLGDWEALQRYLFQQMQVFPEVRMLGVSDRQGRSLELQREGKTGYRLTLVRGRGSTQVFQLDAQGKVVGPSQTIRQAPSSVLADWVRQAVNQRQAVWMKDFQVGRLKAAKPLKDGRGRIQGAVAAELDFGQMETFLAELDAAKTGRVLILDEMGRLLGSSAAPGTMLGGNQARDPLARTLMQYLNRTGTFEDNFKGLPESSAAQATAPPLSARLKTETGEPVFVQVHPYKPYRSDRWLIAIAIPDRAVMGQIRENTQQTLGLSGVALVLALGAAVGTTRWLVRPIRQLSQAAGAIAQGDWEQTLACDRGDEVGELSRSFGEMVGRLKTSFRQLEDNNRELRRLDQLKDEFLANTSHELRTPLTGILGLAEALQAGSNGPVNPTQSDTLGLIAASARRLGSLVNDVLDLAKLKHDNLELHCQPVDLHGAVQVVLAVCQTLVDKRFVDQGFVDQSFVDQGFVASGSADQRLRQHDASGDRPPLGHRTLSHRTLSQRTLRHRTLSLINQVPLDLPLAFADENRLQQILYNLISNAIKFTPEGTVTVSAQDQGNWLLIQVTDTGVGIAPEDCDRIFRAFEQGDGSTTRAYGGTGLGLTITKTFVELHGGTISVSSSLGQGSVFSFTLPMVREVDGAIGNGDEGGRPYGDLAESQVTQLSRADAAMLDMPMPTMPMPTIPISTLPIATLPIATMPSPGLQRALAEGKQIRILVVDDDPINLRVLQSQLALAQYDVVQAMDGDQALRLLERGEQFDLVLLDVMMPRVSGYEVCQTLRSRYPAYQLPVVMLTAKNQLEDLVIGFGCGANDYLTKPFSKDELLSRVQSHLSNTAYGRFVPLHFIEFLQKDSITDIQLGNHVSREMAVMFSDIRGFTSLSESMTPQQNFDFVNTYLSQVSPHIRAYNGFIVKYLGDGMMAIFPEGPEDALQAAIAKLRQVDQYNSDRYLQGLVPIHIGVGIHFGPMMVGIIGEAGRMQGDAFSDDVNLTARLEGLTKFYGVSLIVSEQAFTTLSNPQDYGYRWLDKVLVKGRQHPLVIYEVFEGDPTVSRAAKQMTLPQFSQGIEAYQAQNFKAAESWFSQVLQILPSDRPSQLYCERSRWLQANPPGPDWDGVWVWQEK